MAATSRTIALAENTVTPLSFGTFPTSGSVSAIRIQNPNYGSLHVLVTATATAPTLADFNSGEYAAMVLERNQAMVVNADTLADYWPGKSLPLYFWGIAAMSMRVPVDHA